MAKSKAKAKIRPAKAASTRAARQVARPAAKAAAKPAPAGRATRARSTGWVDAGKGYELAIQNGAIVARKDGALVAGIPRPLKDAEVVDRLAAAVDFLADHARSCVATVETWMLRSLPAPRRVLAAVFADEAWRAALADAWIVPLDPAGHADPAAGGFLRAIDLARGIGVVDRDGETRWIDTDRILVPHPILLDAVDDLRSLAVELGVTQGISQLFRETFAPPAAAPVDPRAIDRFAGGAFATLAAAIGAAKQLGYRVIGGSASTRVLEHGRFVEARYYLGDGDPMDSAETGDLTWLDDKQKQLAIADVPPVAFSEGMRMASAIHARRKLDEAIADG